jgi:hypothetical protein
LRSNKLKMALFGAALNFAVLLTDANVPLSVIERVVITGLYLQGSVCSYHLHHDDTRTRRPWHRD